MDGLSIDCGGLQTTVIGSDKPEGPLVRFSGLFQNEGGLCFGVPESWNQHANHDPLLVFRRQPCSILAVDTAGMQVVAKCRQHIVVLQGGPPRTHAKQFDCGSGALPIASR